MNMKKKKSVFVKLISFVLCMGIMLGICGCGSTDTGSYDFYVYYISTNGVSLSKVGYTPKADPADANAMVNEVIDALMNPVANAKNCTPPLENTELYKSFSIEKNMLTLNFEKKYLTMEKYMEVSVRAAIVKTLCQIDGVDAVFFTVEESPLVDAAGNPIGGMKAENFASISIDSLSITQNADLKLYFGDETGNMLVKETKNVHYMNTVSLERVVVEQLMAGSSKNNKNIISSATKLLGVTVKDGLCTVNFDDNFLKGDTGVAPEVTIYAIVNSLIELSSVNKVQIAVNSETDIKYMDTVPLSSPFIRNLDIVKGE